MRRFLLAVFLLFAFLSGTAAPKVFDWSIDRIAVRGGEDSVRVSVAWTFKDWDIRDGGAMVFMLSLKGSGGEFILRPVSVYGRKAARSASAIMASGRVDEHAVTDLSQPRQFVFEESFPMRPGMDTLKLLLQLSEWTKGSGLAVRSTSQRGIWARPPRPSDFSFSWEPAEPAYQGGEYVSRSFAFPVQFEGASVKYDPGYDGNDASVDAVLPLLKALTSSGRFRFRSASLTLTVPPASSMKESAKLSKQRVSSLYAYLRKRGAFSSVTASCVGAGEDWDGIRGWIMSGPYRDDARLLEITTWDSPEVDRPAVIRREKPAAWDALSSECFPHLGRAVVDVTYKALTFKNVKQAAAVYGDVPEALTPWDFYILLSLYGKGSSEWLDVVLTGAELHPDCPELNYNAAMALLDAGYLNRASAFIRRCGDGGMGLYAQAYWLYLSDRYGECVSVLEDLSAVSSDYRMVYERAKPFIQWVSGDGLWRKVNL